MTRLAQRPMTVSEMGRRIGLDKAAVHRHMAFLVQAGLLERLSSGRKWVYYRLANTQAAPTDDRTSPVRPAGGEPLDEVHSTGAHTDPSPPLVPTSDPVAAHGAGNA